MARTRELVSSGVGVVAVPTLAQVVAAGNAAGNILATVTDPVAAQDAATKHYTDAADTALAAAVAAAIAAITPGLVLRAGATTTLTDAQIKALPTTGITIVAAPGAGFFLSPLFVLLTCDAMAGAYTNINAGCSIRCRVGATVLVTQIAEAGVAFVTALIATPATVNLGFLGQYNLAAAGANQTNLGRVTTRAALENVALDISASNGGSGNFTGGNAANTLKVTPYYYVVPIP